MSHNYIGKDGLSPYLFVDLFPVEKGATGEVQEEETEQRVYPEIQSSCGGMRGGAWQMQTFQTTLKQALEGPVPKLKKPCVEQEVKEESGGNIDEDSDRLMV